MTRISCIALLTAFAAWLLLPTHQASAVQPIQDNQDADQEEGADQQDAGDEADGEQADGEDVYYENAPRTLPVYQPAQPDLFYNFYMPSSVGGPTAALYPAPRPVPPHVGHVYYTYQPFLPHEHLYTHSRVYYTNHGGTHFIYGPAGGNGAGCMHGNCSAHLGSANNMVNRTTVTWQRGAWRPGVLPGFHLLSARPRIGAGCVGPACGATGCNGAGCGAAGCRGTGCRE